MSFIVSLSVVLLIGENINHYSVVSLISNLSNSFARLQFFKMAHMNEYATAKIEDHSSDTPKFSKDPTCCENTITVFLEKNCSVLATENVRRQISEHLKHI